MASNIANDFPPSPTNDEPEEEEQDLKQEEEEPNDSVARILKQLQTTGAIIKAPKREHRCNTCDLDFTNWPDLENHLIQHVSLPSIILEKVPSDDELDHSGDENWSDEDEAPPPVKTPQKIDVSQLLKQKGIQIKNTGTPPKTADSALSKLSGLGFTIKKNLTPIKEEKQDKGPDSNALIKKLGNLNCIKLKLKSDGSHTNSFKVVNGLKDFKTSDDEEDGSGNESDQEQDKSGDAGASGGEQESGDEQNKDSGEDEQNKDSGEDEQNKDSGEDEQSNLDNQKGLQVKSKNNPKLITPKEEPEQPVPPNRRPAVKQTPKRASNISITPGTQIKPLVQAKVPPTQAKAPPPQVVPPTQAKEITTTSEPPGGNNDENVIVKQEIDSESGQPSSDTPLFSGQIKTERSSPPIETVSTPIIARVKTETEPILASNSQPLFSNQSTSVQSTTSLLPVTKTENSSSMTIIEINGDSNDEDDDCCVVSATPAPDIKPVIPKTEVSSSYAPPTSYPSLQTNYNTTTSNTNRPNIMEKQHSFNWNAPDTKPAIDMLERSADDIFESLLSSTKKEGGSLSDTSEYISLDRLGSQHTCDICNTRFTDISLLEDHIRTTGHSRSIVIPTSSNMLSYGHSSTNPLLSSLLPVKQIAEQVGKLSVMGAGSSPYTHQQNVMINIQAYPQGGMAPPPYGSYQPGQNMPSNYPQGAQNNMYGPQGQQMPGQYPGAHYMGQQGYGQQFQKPGFPGQMPQYQSTPYSTASPLQSMQQAVYGQTGHMNASSSQLGQMGPPAMPSPNHPYSASPGGTMKQQLNAPPGGASGIRIHNVQTFPPGQLVGTNGQPMQPGQVATSQSPTQLRIGANLAGTRPRMPAAVRGPRPSIRPGIHVQGQVRGARPGAPRMMKRPGGMQGGPAQKRRTDMLLPGKHDNEDCQVMAMQKQREGLPMIHSVQGAKDKLNLGSQISITKKTVNREASAMANVLASRGISIKQKQKSRSPSPERPLPHIPNLGAGMSIKHTSKSSNFSIPEAKVGSSMFSCKICKKMFMNASSLSVHMANAHPQSKVPVFKCDECPAAYPKSLQLQHHKRTFHNATGPNRELGLPVVDLSQPDNLQRLSNLGIYSFIPLATREQANGSFGIPVISVHNMQNGITSSLQALGADGLLSLGPLKPLPNT